MRIAGFIMIYIIQRILGIFILLSLGHVFHGQDSRLTTLPPNFYESEFATGFIRPTTMQFAPDGRLFVLEQTGTIRIVEANGYVQPEPFISLNVNDVGERGLLGIAFDPNFEQNQYVYLYYTTNGTTIFNRLSRFQANGNKALLNSETILLDLPPLNKTNHNGGALHFGIDGKLYVAVGDNAVPTLAPDLNSVKGKILRINSDGTIPIDNPFYNQTAGNNRAIWATGLRNPYNLTVQPGTGRIMFNDVGQASWEEVNDGIAGANYGWPATEGETSDPEYTSPVYAYPHAGSGINSGCAIIGSAFYNPAINRFPTEYIGDYFFTDFCNGWIAHYDPITDSVGYLTETPVTGGLPADLRVSEDGHLYYISRTTNTVYRIKYDETTNPPIINTPPQDTTTHVGGNVTFFCGADGSGILSYQWQRWKTDPDGFDIVGDNSNTLTLANVSNDDHGAAFRCVVSNDFGQVTSSPAVLGVYGNNLLVFSDFETDQDNNQIPDHWTPVQLSGAKIKCNRPDKTLAYEGNCAFKMKGKGNRFGKLKQVLDTRLWNGANTLTLSAWINAINTDRFPDAKLKVTYTDGTKAKLKLLANPNVDGYAYYVDTLELSKTPKKLKVFVRNRSNSGKTWFDALNLVAGSNTSTMPLPAPPVN